MSSAKVNGLTVEQAFRAMYVFIERHHALAPSGGTAALLADIEMLSDGSPGDPAAWDDWLDAVEKARGSDGVPPPV